MRCLKKGTAKQAIEKIRTMATTDN